MTHRTLFGLALILLGTTIAAQQPAAPDKPTTFSSRTELVTVPVIVNDKSGKHMTGLKQTDFTLEENGHRREIANFEEITTTAAPLKPRPAAQYEFSNFIPSDGQTRRVTIIVVDLLNTPFLYQARARAEIVKFLSNHLQDNGPTALNVLNRNGLRPVHSFTTDTSVLIAALNKLKSNISTQDELATGAFVNPESSNALDDPSSTEASQLLEIMNQRADADFGAYKQRIQTLTTLDALDQIAQSYAGIPGRKTLIWATGGLPFLLNDPDSVTGIDTTLMDNYQRTWRALNAAEIAVYPVDAQGLLGPDLSQRAMSARSRPPAMTQASRTGVRAPTPLPVDPRQNAQDSLRAFAHSTGGHPCINQNDLATCFARAEEDSSQYYLLSYYLPSDDRKPGWRKLKVQVAGAHGEIRARDGFYVGDNPAPDSKRARNELQLAYSSPLAFTAVPMEVHIAKAAPAENNTRKVSFDLHFPANSISIAAPDNAIGLDIEAIATDEKGKSVRVFAKTISAHLKPESLPGVNKNGFRLAEELVIAKGHYQLLFVVRDDGNGKIGTLGAPLQVD
ncbi:VWA domain-containing protein [Candidatus Korobacter versatilis]|uniref:VWA domain-containing protein n=1 Tax=Candidatus Korobacter versatilis TaxID=658062 RepID=UPI0002E73FE5|nr:VWA domain-containing protein [Candidatus Koribacter versatilis]